MFQTTLIDAVRKADEVEIMGNRCLLRTTRDNGVFALWRDDAEQEVDATFDGDQTIAVGSGGIANVRAATGEIVPVRFLRALQHQDV